VLQNKKKGGKNRQLDNHPAAEIKLKVPQKTSFDAVCFRVQ
jgi:hypothetical protein